MDIALFLTLKFFPIWLSIIDLYGCLLIFVVTCIFGTIFVIFLMDETKATSMEEDFSLTQRRLSEMK